VSFLVAVYNQLTIIYGVAPERILDLQVFPGSVAVSTYIADTSDPTQPSQSEIVSSVESDVQSGVFVVSNNGNTYVADEVSCFVFSFLFNLK
jgi:hypothetical protein